MSHADLEDATEEDDEFGTYSIKSIYETFKLCKNDLGSILTKRQSKHKYTKRALNVPKTTIYEEFLNIL